MLGTRKRRLDHGQALPSSWRTLYDLTRLDAGCSPATIRLTAIRTKRSIANENRAGVGFRLGSNATNDMAAA